MVDIFTYTKNVAKSTLYSAGDVIKEKTPAVESFMSTNREVLTGLYDMAKDYRNFGKRMQSYVKSSKIYEAASEGAKAILEDISTGNFYNKERIERFESRAMGDMMDLDVDTDLSKFDTGNADNSSDDWDFGDEESSPNDDVVAAVHLSSKDNAEAMGKINARIGANIASTNRANTMLMLNQQIKSNDIMSKGFSSIFDRMGEQNSKINSSLESMSNKAMEYYDKSLTLSQDRNNMIKEMLDIMKTNSGMIAKEEQNKKSKNTYSDIVDANGMPDLKAYWANIKRNAVNALPSEVKMIFGNNIGGEGANNLLAWVASPLQVVTDTIAKTIIPKMVTKTMQDFDTTLSGSFSGLMAQLNKLAVDEDSPLLKKYLGKIFGVKTKNADSVNPSDYNKGVVPFDGVTRKAIIEVIPGYLRKIESALTGEGERVFSFSDGKWSTGKKIKETYTNISKNAYKSASADIKDEMMGLILSSGKFSKSDSKLLQNNIDKFLRKIIVDEYGNPREMMSNSTKKYKDKYLDYGVDSSELMELLVTAFKSTNRGTRSQLSKNAFEAKETIADRLNSIIKNNQEMIELFNGSDIDAGYTWDKDGGKRRKAPGHLFNNTIDKILDNKGHNLYYYLQNMLREMVTFRNNRYGNFGGYTNYPGGQGNGPTGSNTQNRINLARRPRPVAAPPAIGLSYDIPNDSEARKASESKWRERQRDDNEIEAYRKSKKAKPVWDTSDEAALGYIRSNIRQLGIKKYGDQNNYTNSTRENRYYMYKNSNAYKEYYNANKTILDEYIEEQRAERRARGEKLDEEMKASGRKDDYNFDDTTPDGKKKKSKIKKNGIIDKLLQAETLEDKMTVFSNGMDEILEAPGKYLSSIMMKADERLYDLIFGKEGVKNNKTGKEANGIMDAMVIGIQNTFEKVNNWLDEKILDPIKKKLGIETFGDAVQKFFGLFGIDFNASREGFVDWLFKDNGIIKNIKTQVQESWENLLESVSPGIGAANAAKTDADLINQILPTASHEDTVRRLGIMAYTNDRKNKDTFMPIQEFDSIASKIFSQSGSKLLRSNNIEVGAQSSRLASIRKTGEVESFRKLLKTPNGEEYAKKYCKANKIKWPLTGYSPEQERIYQIEIVKSYNNDVKRLINFMENNVNQEFADNFDLDINAIDVFNNIISNNINSPDNINWDNALNTVYKQASIYNKYGTQSGLEKYKANQLNELQHLSQIVSGADRGTADITNSSIEANFDLIKNGGYQANEEIERIRHLLPRNIQKKLFKTGSYHPLGWTYANGSRNSDDTNKFIKVIKEYNNTATASYNAALNNRNTENSNAVTKALRNYYKAKLLKEAIDADPNNTSDLTTENADIDATVEHILSQFNLKDFYKNNDSDLNFNGGLARGSRLVTKTGLYTIHRGEAVIPSEYVPRSINGQTPGAISKQKEIDDENRVKDRYLKYLGSRIGSAAESNVAVLDSVPETMQAQTEEVNNKNNYRAGKKIRQITSEDYSKKIAVPVQKALKDAMGEKTYNNMRSGFEKYAAPGIGGGLIGGGIGLGSSLVFGLAGGPIIGAAVGAAANIARNSESFSEFLFGERIEGQYDNGAQKRAGGVFSLETQEAWHKYFPSMTKGGGIGALAGMLTPLGPIGGLMVGSAIGFAKKNDDFQGLLFGENGLFKEEDKEKFKKALPAGLVGGGIGALALSGPFGLLGGAAVGALGGISATTETFKRIMLGKETQQGFDKDGNPIMKRHGGIVGTIAKISIEPLKDGVNYIKTTLKDFMQKDIINPLKRAVKPVGNMFRNMFTEIKEGVVGTLNRFFEKRLGVPVEDFIKDRILTPIGNAAKNILKFPFKMMGKAISLPFRALGFVGDNIRANQIKRGTDRGSTAAERLDWRDNHKIRSKKIFGIGKDIDGFRKADEWINSASSSDIETLTRDLRNWTEVDQDYYDIKKKRKEDIAGSVNEFFDDKRHGGFFTKNHLARKKILTLIRDDKFDEAYDLIKTLRGRDGKPLNPDQIEELLNNIHGQVEAYEAVKNKKGSNANYRRTVREKLANIGFKNTTGKTNINNIIRMLEDEKTGRKKQGLWDDNTEHIVDAGNQNTQQVVTAINTLTTVATDIHNALVDGTFTRGKMPHDGKSVGKIANARLQSANKAQEKTFDRHVKASRTAAERVIEKTKSVNNKIDLNFIKNFGLGKDVIDSINTNDPEDIRRIKELGPYCMGSNTSFGNAGIAQSGLKAALTLSKTKFKLLLKYVKLRIFPMNADFINLINSDISKNRLPVMNYIIGLGDIKVRKLIGYNQKKHENFIKNDLPKLVSTKNYKNYIKDYLDNESLLENVSISDFIDHYGAYAIRNNTAGFNQTTTNSDYHTAVIHAGEIVTDDIPGYAEGRLPYVSNIDKNNIAGWNKFKANMKTLFTGDLSDIADKERFETHSESNTFGNSVQSVEYEEAMSSVEYRLKLLKKKTHPTLSGNELKWLSAELDTDYTANASNPDEKGINTRALTGREIAVLRKYYKSYLLNKFKSSYNKQAAEYEKKNASYRNKMYGKSEADKRLSNLLNNKKHSNLTDEELDVLNKSFNKDYRIGLNSSIGINNRSLTDDEYDALSEYYNDKYAINPETDSNISMGLEGTVHRLLMGHNLGGKSMSKKKKTRMHELIKNYNTISNNSDLTAEEKEQSTNGILSDIKKLLSYNVTDDGDTLKKLIDKNGKVYVNKLDPENKKALKEGKTNNIIEKAVSGIHGLLSNVKGYFTDKVDGDKSRLDKFGDFIKGAGKFLLKATIAGGLITTLLTKIAPKLTSSVSNWWDDSGKQTVSNVKDKVTDWAKNDLPGYAKNAWDNTISFLGDALGNVKDWTVENLPKIATAVGGGAVKVLSYLGQAVPYAASGAWDVFKSLTGLNSQGTGTGAEAKLLKYATRSVLRGSEFKGLRNFALKLPGVGGFLLNKPVTLAAHGVGNALKFAGKGVRSVEDAIVNKAMKNAVTNTASSASDTAVKRIFANTLQGTSEDALAQMSAKQLKAYNKKLDKTFATQTVDDLAAKVAKENLTGDAMSRIISTGVKENTSANAVNAAKKLAKNNVSAWMTALLTKFATWLKKKAANYLSEKVVVKLTKPSTWINIGKKLVGKAADIAGDATAKLATYVASANPIGVIIQTAFSIYDFVVPLASDANAMEILGITDPPTFPQKLIAALVNCLMGLPIVFGGIIPASIIIDVLFDVLHVDLAGIQEARQKAKDELAAYNASTNSTYDVALDEYNTGKGYHTFGLIDSIARGIGGGEQGIVDRIKAGGGDQNLTVDSFEEFSKKYNEGTLTDKDLDEYIKTVEDNNAQQAVYQTESTSIWQDIKNSLNILTAYVTGVDPQRVEYNSYSDKSTLTDDINTDIYNTLIDRGYSQEDAARMAGEYDYGTGSGRYSQKDKSINMRFNKKSDSIYQDLNSSGCGPIAATNLINRNIKYGTGFVNPRDAANYALHNGYKETNGGTDPRYFTSYFRKNGINSYITSDHNIMRSAIKNGQQVVLMGSDSKYGMGNGTPFGPNPHYVTATGIRGNNIIIDNPELDSEYTMYDADDTINKSRTAIITNSKYGMGTEPVTHTKVTMYSDAGFDKLNNQTIAYNNNRNDKAADSYADYLANKIKSINIDKFDINAEQNSHSYNDLDKNGFIPDSPESTNSWIDSVGKDPLNAATSKYSSIYRSYAADLPQMLYEIATDRIYSKGGLFGIGSGYNDKYKKYLDSSKTKESNNVLNIVKVLFNEPTKFKKYLDNTAKNAGISSYKFNGLNDLFNSNNKLMYSGFSADENSLQHEYDPSALVTDLATYLNQGVGDSDPANRYAGVLTRFILSGYRFNQLKDTYTKIIDSIKTSRSSYDKQSELTPTIRVNAQRAFWSYLANIIGDRSSRGLNTIDYFVPPDGLSVSDYDSGNSTYISIDKFAGSTAPENNTKTYGNNATTPYITMDNYTSVSDSNSQNFDLLNSIFWNSMGRPEFGVLTGAANIIPYMKIKNMEGNVTLNTAKSNESNLKNIYADLASYIKSANNGNIPGYITPWILRDSMAEYMRDTIKKYSTKDKKSFEYAKDISPAAKILNAYGHIFYGNSKNATPTFADFDNDNHNLARAYIKILKGLDSNKDYTDNYRLSSSSITDDIQSIMGDWDADPGNFEDFNSITKYVSTSDIAKRLIFDKVSVNDDNLTNSDKSLKDKFGITLDKYLLRDVINEITNNGYHDSMPLLNGEYSDLHYFTEKDKDFLIRLRDRLLSFRTQKGPLDSSGVYGRTLGEIINDNNIDRSIYPGLNYIDTFNSFINNIEKTKIDTNSSDANAATAAKWFPTDLYESEASNPLGTERLSFLPAFYDNFNYAPLPLKEYNDDGSIKKTNYKTLREILNGIVDTIAGSTTGELNSGVGMPLQLTAGEQISDLITKLNTDENGTELDPDTISRIDKFDKLDSYGQAEVMLNVLNSQVGRNEVADTDLLYPSIRKGLANLGLLNPALFKYFFLNNSMYAYDSNKDSDISYIDKAINNATGNLSSIGNGINAFGKNVMGENAVKSLYGRSDIISSISNTDDIKKFVTRNITYYTTSKNDDTLADSIYNLSKIIYRDRLDSSFDDDDAIKNKTISSYLEYIANTYSPMYSDAAFASSPGIIAFKNIINTLNGKPLSLTAVTDATIPNSVNSGSGKNGSNGDTSTTGNEIDFSGLGITEFDEIAYRDIRTYSSMTAESVKRFIEARQKSRGHGDRQAPIGKYASTFISKCKEYDIDPRVVLAIMCTETSGVTESDDDTITNSLRKCNYMSIMGAKTNSDGSYDASTMHDFSTTDSWTASTVTFKYDKTITDYTSKEAIERGVDVACKFIRKVSYDMRGQKTLFSLNFKVGFIYMGTKQWLNTVIGIIKTIESYSPNTNIKYINPTPIELSDFRTLTGSSLNEDKLPDETSESSTGLLGLMQNLAKAIIGEDWWNLLRGDNLSYSSSTKNAYGAAGKVYNFNPNKRYSSLKDLFSNGLMQGTVFAPSVYDGGQFGPRIIDGKIQNHWGEDISSSVSNTPIGSPVNGEVLTVTSGKVNYNDAGYDKTGYGNHITVLDDNPDGRRVHLFAHLSKINPNIKKGATISIGDEIGNMGNTGFSTGPHLHYGVAVPRSDNTINWEKYFISEKANGDYDNANSNTELAPNAFTKYVTLDDYSDSSGWINPELYLSDYLERRNKELNRALGYDIDAAIAKSSEFVEENADALQKVLDNIDTSTVTYSADQSFSSVIPTPVSTTGQGSGRTVSDQMIIDNINNNGIGGVGGAEDVSSYEKNQLKQALTSVKKKQEREEKRAIANGTARYGMGGSLPSSTNTDEKILTATNTQTELLAAISTTLKSIESISKQNNALVATIMSAVQKGEISPNSDTYKALMKSLNDSANSSTSGADSTSVLVNSMLSIARG